MQAVKEYLEGPFQSVHGWCIPHLWQAIQPIREFQRTKAVPKPVAEIGVHRGKFFIGLVKTAEASKGNLAIDIFEKQEFNLDKSGEGSSASFEAKLRECGVARESVEILVADSLSLGDDDLHRIRQSSGEFSFFSIDGCHMAEHTYNDVKIAMRLTAPEGIVFVDDYYHPNWPGVQEGVAKLYFTEFPKFVPLCFTSGKLFLAHLSYHAAYLDVIEKFIRTNHPDTGIKVVKKFGYDSLALAPNFKTGRVLI
jgi:hypothetical protein